MLLLVGVVDFARIFYFDVVVSGAAAEGVSAAALGAPDSGVTAAAQNSAPSFIRPDLSATVRPAAAARVAGPTPVWTTVTATYTVQPLTLLMSSLLGGGYTVTRSASQWMRTPCVVASGLPC